MLFNFRLFPFFHLISEIEPLEDERLRSPSWYRLSDGWYWIDVGETQLFRYTSECDVQPLRPESGLYVDYYLGAFFRDLLERLPAMLEPIPEALAERLSSITAWNDWVDARNEAWSDKDEEDVEIDDVAIEEGAFYNDGISWWYHRSIDVIHLNAGPHIWIWNDGTNIHIGWDNRNRLINDVPAWEAQTGQIALPIADFIKELLAFDHQLMTQMAERIVIAPSYWADPRFTNALLSLQQEHQDYATMLENTLSDAVNRPPTDWQRVQASLATSPPIP